MKKNEISPKIIKKNMMSEKTSLLNTKTTSNTKKNIKSKKPTSKKKKRMIAANPLRVLKKHYSIAMYAPIRSSMIFRILIITVAALIVTFSLDSFIHPAKLYSGGLRGAQQMILYAVPYIEIHQWIGYLIFFGLNIPLAYFGFKYIGVKYTFLTLYFILIQTFFSYVMSLPEIHNHIKVFPIHQVGDKVNSIVVTEQMFREDTTRYLAGTIGAVVYGVGIALTFVVGASSGGSKFIVTYISEKYKLSLGKVGIGIAVVVVLTGIIFNSIIMDKIYWIEAFLSVKLFASALYVAIQNTLINVIAPRTKITKIEIQTSQADVVKKVVLGTILDKRTWYSYRIKKNINKSRSSIFVLTVDKREADYVLRKLNKALPKSYISSYDVKLRTEYFKTRRSD